MRYISTRGRSAPRPFCDILLEGLAPDGGLYQPVRYPRVSAEQLQRWRALPYADLAFEILSLYIDDIPAADLRAICARTYTAEVFGTSEIAPLRELKEPSPQPSPGGRGSEPSGELYLLALSNGPTLAFKDMAMQLLGQLFEYELARRGETLNILGATSGDTGSAAEYAMRGKQRLRVFMTSPHGRMSPFQQAQMFSLQDENIHNIAIRGVFDDCQDIVKSVSGDLEFKRRMRVGTVNSINWARLLAQVVYYFAGYFQATGSGSGPHPSPLPEGEAGMPRKVSFAVPSGNFGNACAGHVARMMGLPIDRLVVASNENDVLDEFFRTGVYRVRASADTLQTSSPSMDISKASNFERFIADLLGRDAERVSQLFGEALAGSGRFDLSQDPVFALAATHYGMVSGRSTHADRLATIRDAYQRYGVMLDPHTADGLKVARQYQRPGVPMVVMETALPIKFSSTLVEALGHAPELPAQLAGLEELPRRVVVMDADAGQVKDYIERHGH